MIPSKETMKKMSAQMHRFFDRLDQKFGGHFRIALNDSMLWEVHFACAFDRYTDEPHKPLIVGTFLEKEDAITHCKCLRRMLSNVLNLSHKSMCELKAREKEALRALRETTA